jgi:hypothetical protein
MPALVGMGARITVSGTRRQARLQPPKLPDGDEDQAEGQGRSEAQQTRWFVEFELRDPVDAHSHDAEAGDAKIRRRPVR